MRTPPEGTSGFALLNDLACYFRCTLPGPVKFGAGFFVTFLQTPSFDMEPLPELRRSLMMLECFLALTCLPVSGCSMHPTSFKGPGGPGRW